MTQTIGTTETSNLYQSWLVSVRGATPLTRKEIPAIDPPHSFGSGIPVSGIGQVGVLGTLHSLSDLSMCYDFAIADTGGAGPTVAELEEILGRSGIAPFRK